MGSAAAPIAIAPEAQQAAQLQEAGAKVGAQLRPQPGAIQILQGHGLRTGGDGCLQHPSFIILPDEYLQHSSIQHTTWWTRSILI